MKPILLLICALLSLFPASAAIRARRAAPMLHSIFDEKPRSSFYGNDDYVRPFLPTPPGRTPHLSAKRFQKKRRVGAVLLIASGAAFLIGTGLLVSAATEDKAGIYSATGIPAMGLIGASLGLGLAGFNLSTKYCKKRELESMQ